MQNLVRSDLTRIIENEIQENCQNSVDFSEITIDKRYIRKKRESRAAQKRYSVNREGAASVDMVRDLKKQAKPFHESFLCIKVEPNTKSVACQNDFSSSGEHFDLIDLDSEFEEEIIHSTSKEEKPLQAHSPHKRNSLRTPIIFTPEMLDKRENPQKYSLTDNDKPNQKLLPTISYKFSADLSVSQTSGGYFTINNNLGLKENTNENGSAQSASPLRKRVLKHATKIPNFAQINLNLQNNKNHQKGVASEDCSPAADPFFSSYSSFGLGETRPTTINKFSYRKKGKDESLAFNIKKLFEGEQKTQSLSPAKIREKHLMPLSRLKWN
ncbi:unnamed protein product [Blepharisma stoltei]|uniref:Uncharacterized protein n=1 Tax=Blepharisma stoltei TaxID=1481888 RepID=A0AAU9J3Y7_9CILI|nr:unnamed protein product [Blepharisma stoltei]